MKTSIILVPSQANNPTENDMNIEEMRVKLAEANHAASHGATHQARSSAQYDASWWRHRILQAQGVVTSP